MARTRYLPEREKPERRYGKDDEDQSIAEARPVAEVEMPEFASVEAFVESLLDEERETFTTAELVCLAKHTGIHNTPLRGQLEGYGFKLVAPARERNFATFGTNQMDRWTNAEARRMNGGGGGNSIIGMAS